jgi:hypothetical protein
MEKKVTRNKAEAPADANKAEGFSPDEVAARARDRAALLDAMKEKLAGTSDAELHDAFAEGEAFRRAVNDEAAKRGVALGLGIAPPVRLDAAAGKYEGSFICRRPMSGDKNYSPNDPREAVVSEVIHLVERGALSPADDETAAHIKAFAGLDVAVFTPPAPVAAEGE